MATNPRDDTEPVYEITPKSSASSLNRARASMGISVEEFLRRLDDGDYEEIIDKASHPHGMDIVYLEMMRPGGSS